MEEQRTGIYGLSCCGSFCPLRREKAMASTSGAWLNGWKAGGLGTLALRNHLDNFMHTGHTFKISFVEVWKRGATASPCARHYRYA